MTTATHPVPPVTVNLYDGAVFNWLSDDYCCAYFEVAVIAADDVTGRLMLVARGNNRLYLWLLASPVAVDDGTSLTFTIYDDETNTRVRQQRFYRT